MKQQNKKITLQTNVEDATKRIDELVGLFNDWIAVEEKPSSIYICFITSASHPLTMGEIAHFLNSTADSLDGCDVEWSHKADELLNEEIRIEITTSKK